MAASHSIFPGKLPIRFILFYVHYKVKIHRNLCVPGLDQVYEGLAPKMIIEGEGRQLATMMSDLTINPANTASCALGKDKNL